MKDDIELPASESHDANSVLALMDECRKEVDSYALRYLSQAEYNERMCEGDQLIELGTTWAIDDAQWPDDVPRTNRNLLRNLRLTWSSRILEDRPFISAYPAEPGADQMKADLANKILEFLRQQYDWDDMCFRAAQLVQPHSCVGWKVVWDPLRGPPSKGVPVLDEFGQVVVGPDGQPVLEKVGEPLGDVSIELVTIFDFGVQATEDVESAKWCFFGAYKDEWDARYLLNAAGMREDPKVEEYSDVWGVKKRGVRVYELWWKPDYRFPEGLYAIIVGDKVVEARPFPYEHGELPLAVWKCGSRRNSPYGSTHMDDAVPIQKNINEIVASLQAQARQIGSIKALLHPAIAEQWENGNQIIKVPDPTMAQYARYLDPPNRAEVLVSSLEDNVQALFSVFGLNEMLTGAENIKSGTAAKSIAYLNKLDSMKMAGAARNFGKCVLRVFRQSLKLYQQYVPVPRLMQISGQAGTLGSTMFQGADLAGVDVRLEAASAIPNYRGAIAGEADEQMAQQGPTPQLQEQKATGLREDAFTAAQRDMVRAQVEALMRGEPQQADPQIQPDIATAEISRLSSHVRGTPAAQALAALFQQYRSMMGQQPQEGQQ